MRRILTFSLICAASAPLFAQTSAPPSAPVANRPAEEKKICRREETTGSLMSRRICHTKTEWSQIDRANQRARDQFKTARDNGQGVNGRSQ